jgi:hypothetical protein
MVIDFRSQLSPAQDQGMRQTCVAFAAGAFNELAQRYPCSAEFLAWCSVKVSSAAHEDEGVPLSAAGEVLVRLGQPSEVAWSYKATPAGSPPVSVFRAARSIRRHDHVVSRGFDPASAQQELSAGRSVVVGLRISQSFFNITAASPTLDLTPAAGVAATFLHAVALVGHLGTRNPWLLRNSWGASWGDGGHAYASDDYMKASVEEMLVVEP